MSDIHPGYSLHDGPPSVADYMRLRHEAGLTPKSEEQARAGIHGAWAAVHVVHDESGATVGMGRVIGDGGWYFHVIDMAVLPDHQHRGLGTSVLEHLLNTVEQKAPPGAFLSLLADEPGQALYARYGFRDLAPRTVGMSQVLKSRPRG